MEQPVGAHERLGVDPAERRERPADRADGDGPEDPEPELVARDPEGDGGRHADDGDHAEEELPQAANAGEQRRRRRCGLLRIRPVGLRRLPGGAGATGGRRRLDVLVADRRQAEHRATRLRQRPGIGRVEEVLGNGDRDRVIDSRDQLDLIRGPPGRVQRQPGVARREHDGQALGQRVPDAVACLVQQGASAGRRDGALERLDQPVTISARAQGDAVSADPSGGRVDRLEHDLDPQARAAASPGTDSRLGWITGAAAT